MDAADVCAEAGGIGIFRDRDEDFDIVGCGAALELGTRLEIPCISTVAAKPVTEVRSGQE